MRELPVARLQIRDEEGNVHSYEYGILVGEMAVSGGMSCECYGVRIAEDGGESQEICNITVSISRIDQLIDLLVKNSVTPCTLRDVVEDWI